MICGKLTECPTKQDNRETAWRSSLICGKLTECPTKQDNRETTWRSSLIVDSLLVTKCDSKNGGMKRLNGVQFLCHIFNQIDLGGWENDLFSMVGID